MKSPCLLVLLAALPLAVGAEEFKLQDGKSISGTLIRTEPDGLTIETDSGIEKVSFDRLTEEQRTKYHYDRETAAGYSQATQAAIRLKNAQSKLAEVIAQGAVEIVAREGENTVDGWLGKPRKQVTTSKDLTVEAGSALGRYNITKKVTATEWVSTEQSFVWGLRVELDKYFQGPSERLAITAHPKVC